MSDRTIEILGSVVSVSFGTGAASLAKLRAGAQIVRPPLDGTYNVSTSGRTAQEVADVIAALGDYHAAKSQRIYDAEPLLGTTFTVDGETFTWATFTVMERGTDCELYIEVFDATGQRHPSTPLRITRRTIAELPSNGDVLQMVTAAIRAVSTAATEQATKLAELQVLLGG